EQGHDIHIIPCPCFFFNKYPQLALRSSHSSKCSQVCRSMSCSKASCMVFSPENSRTTINFTFLPCLFSCFWVFSIGYLHRSEKPDKGHPATKSGNGLRKTCNLSSGHRFLLFKFSCEISLFSLSENRYPLKSLALWAFTVSTPPFLRQQSQQSTDNQLDNKHRKSGNPLLWQLQLTDFFLTQLHKSTFVVGQLFAGNLPFPATLPPIARKHPGIRERLPASHHCVHNLVDVVQLPTLRLLKDVSQRFLEQLLGADHIAGVVFQEALNLPGLSVLRHKVLLNLHQLLLNLL